MMRTGTYPERNVSRAREPRDGFFRVAVGFRADEPFRLRVPAPPGVRAGLRAFDAGLRAREDDPRGAFRG